MIDFQESEDSNYGSRTFINASADVTLAFAIDFTSAGEKLTKQAVKDQRKIYIPISKLYYTGWAAIEDLAFDDVCKYKDDFTSKEIIINVAGNGIYTFKGTTLNQIDIDEYIFKYLNAFERYLKHFKIKIILIRSGGQTGADEAGLKAAVKLNIPALCLAPKGWKFRNQFGQDISDERKFKERFES